MPLWRLRRHGLWRSAARAAQAIVAAAGLSAMFQTAANGSAAVQSERILVVTTNFMPPTCAEVKCTTIASGQYYIMEPSRAALPNE